MPDIQARLQSSLSPARVLHVLTDFGPGRTDAWPMVAPGTFTVHDQGEGWADVTQGNRGAWERLRYVWDATTGTVTAVTTDSNIWRPAAAGRTGWRRPGPAPRSTSGSPGTARFQLTYQTGEPAGDSYLHAQWRRSNLVAAGGPHVLLDGVTGRGHYVGTYLAWGVNSSGWWGEGEVKFYLDDDEECPTICGTGTEDYFGGAWNFDVPGQGYTAYFYLDRPSTTRPPIPTADAMEIG